MLLAVGGVSAEPFHPLKMKTARRTGRLETLVSDRYFDPCYCACCSQGGMTTLPSVCESVLAAGSGIGVSSP